MSVYLQLLHLLNRYRRISETWREAKPPPEEASRLIIQTLKNRGFPTYDHFVIVKILVFQLVNLV